ncbi:MAG: FAD binding domain-containing protein [Pyrobaculum sp.]
MRPPYPRPFKYVKAISIDEALGYIKEGFKPLAGGQSLSTLLKLGLVWVEGLVDIFEIDELRYVALEGETLKIGALTVHNDVAMHEDIVHHAPALAKAAWHIGDLQVRNRGTIGGSIAHADPAANYLPVLMALGGEIQLAGPGGRRRVAVEDFVKGPYATAAEGELVVEVSVPRWPLQAVEVIKRRGAAYPSLVLAAAARVEDGVVVKSRIAVGGLYTTPVVAKGALDGLSLGELPEAEVSLPEGDPYDDPHMRYVEKREALPRYLQRLLQQLGQGYRWALPLRRELTMWRGTGNTATLNGVKTEIDTEPRVLLIDYLRSKGLREVRRGCDEGRCGACTVLVDKKAVKSCTLFAPQAAGHVIETVRSIQGHPIQRAFLEEYASQCGYCTHGFMMALVDYFTIDLEARDEVLKLSIKNICRCTGYINIIKAIKKASYILLSKNL